MRHDTASHCIVPSIHLNALLCDVFSYSALICLNPLSVEGEEGRGGIAQSISSCGEYGSMHVGEVEYASTRYLSLQGYTYCTHEEAYIQGIDAGMEEEEYQIKGCHNIARSRHTPNSLIFR